MGCLCFNERDVKTQRGSEYKGNHVFSSGCEEDEIVPEDEIVVNTTTGYF